MKRYIKSSNTIDDFRAKTDKMFNSWNNYTPQELEEIARKDIEHVLYEQYFLSPWYDVKIVDVILTGSRSRGLERKRSDIDIVLAYTGHEREDTLFDMIARKRLYIGGHRVDVNPINIETNCSLDTYLKEADKYLEDKARGMCK